MAHLRQTAGWGICPEHSGSIALIAQTAKIDNRGNVTQIRSLFLKDGQPDSYRPADSHLPIRTDMG